MSRRRAPATPAAATGIHLALAFILEVAMLAGVGYWGFKGGFQAPWTFVLGIGLPALLIAVWGVFLAPKSTRRLPMPGLAVAAVALFLLSAAALMASGQLVLGWLMAVLALANTALGLYLETRN